MRICLLGSYSGTLDEGMANISYHLSQNLRLIIPDVLLLDVGSVYSFNFWKQLISFKPDIIHYVPGPTLKGFLLGKLAQIMTRGRLVVSATKPDLSPLFRLVSRFLKPDIVIVQSAKNEEFFKKIKYRTVFVPNGVDIDKFVPVSSSRRIELRKKYGFSTDDFIVLHVGPITTGRNQKSLLELHDVKKLLIVSVTNLSEADAYDEFSSTDVIVWRRYFPNIEEIYAMSDIYLFPVSKELNSIDIPLSVLEAMACNLPVITTRFGGLHNILKESDGLFFIENGANVQDLVGKIRHGEFKIDTRQKVTSLSWKNVVHEVALIYNDLTRGE